MPSTLQTVPLVQVFDYLYDLTTGLPIANQNVSISFTIDQANCTAPVVALPKKTVQVQTDQNGYWTISVVPTNLINPTNTTYHVDDGYNQPYDINPIQAGIPAGGWQAVNIKVSPAPAVLPPTTTTVGALTVTGLLQAQAGLTVSGGLTQLLGGATVTGTLTVSNTLTVSAGGMAITGASTVTGTLGVSGLLTASGGLTVVGGATVGGGLTVSSGGASITGAVLITGNAHVTGTSALDGIVTMGAAASAAGEFTAPDFKASGAASLGSPRSGRFIGAWTTLGAPTGLTAQLADHGFDGNFNLWVCSVAGTPGTWVPRGIGRIFDSTAGGTVANFDTGANGIPAGYSYLEIVHDLRGDIGTVDTALAQFNGDNVATNYQTELLNGTNLTAAANQAFQTVAGCQIGVTTGTTSTAATSGGGRTTIPNYSGTTFQKQSFSVSHEWDTNATGQGRIYIHGGRWLNTAAITRILIRPQTSNNWLVGSRVTIYGYP